jgi:5-methylcytosine-specific restriction endonuclease McrA
MVIHFRQAELEFLDWKQANPAGYIVNTTQEPSSGYLVIHKSTCPALKGQSNYTTNGYSKICGTSARAIRAYLIEKLLHVDRLRPCMKCMNVDEIGHAPEADYEAVWNTVEELQAIDTGIIPEGNRSPTRISVTSHQFYRVPAVIDYVLKRSRGRCEACDAPAPFYTYNGTAYLEVHHVKPLASGGSDTVTNTAAVCPNCHRALHHARDSLDRTQALFDKLEDTLIPE